jgi:hypothetical protein
MIVCTFAIENCEGYEDEDFDSIVPNDWNDSDGTDSCK